LEILKTQGPFAVLLTDLMLPRMSGLDLLRKARQLDSYLEVVVITAAPTLENAISALRADGAYDYLLKPLDSMNQLRVAVKRAATHRRLILDREALEAKVRAEAERLQALIASSGDAILSADSQGAITLVNPVAARLLGEGVSVEAQANQVLPRELKTLIANWQAVGGQRPAVIEIPWSDGTIRMVTLTPLLGNGQTWQGWTMIISNITHIKELEQLRNSMLMEALNKFRLPLAQAVGELADLSMLAAKDEKISNAVYRLSRVWGRIKEWADDLMTMLSISSDAEIHHSTVDLRALLQNLYDSQVKLLKRDWGLKLKLEMPPDLPQVSADPELLQRLFDGLIRRAAMRSERAGEVRLQTALQDDQVLINISDDGPPLSEADQPQVFDMSFVKLEGGPVKASFELAMVKTLINRMGGQVWVAGKGPRDNTVSICLPKSHAQAKK
jgi:two-component system sensor histidine kinase ResE